MRLIAAADQNWGIGWRNQLLVQIPEDQRRFREMTLGNMVVMGRKTLESLPGGKPLECRRNLVLTSQAGYDAKGAEVVHSLSEAQQSFQGIEKERIYIIGGESIYRLFLPYCRYAYLTRICSCYPSDAYFPNLDLMPDWQYVGASKRQTWGGLEYYYSYYERRQQGIVIDGNTPLT